MRTEQDANRKVLINNGKKSTEDFGFLSEDFESEEIDVTLKTWYSFEEHEA